MMKSNQHCFIVFYILIFLFVFTLSPTYSQLTYFTDVTVTNVYHQYVGKVTLENDAIENGQDELGIYVTDNNGGTILIGAAIIGETYSGYYFISVFGDESGTVIKDGAYMNDVFTFKIWDKSNDKLYVLSNDNSLSVETVAGVNTPELPPRFQSGFGSQYGYLHLVARNEDLLAHMISFNAIPQTDQIQLSWATSMEIDNAGFYIFRKDPLSNAFHLISDPLIPSKGNEFSGATYCFSDPHVVYDAKYIYQLRSVDLNGQQTIIQTTDSLSIIEKNNGSCSLRLDLTGDCQLNMADIIRLMKILGH